MKTTTAERIKEIMNIKELRQVDVLKRAQPYCEKYGVKLGRNDLSQYISGKVSPGQEKLTILALALNVSEVWLMGYDVTMERDDYEDQNILKYDAELSDALDILEVNGYSWNYSQDPDYDIIIKNSLGKIVSCMHEYDLVSNYEAIQKKGSIVAELLINADCCSLSDKEQHHIKKYRTLDPTGQSHVDTVLDWETARSADLLRKDTRISDLEAELANVPSDSAALLNAAHERTDIPVTEEMKQADDDIMNDENF